MMFQFQSRSQTNLERLGAKYTELYRRCTEKYRKRLMDVDERLRGEAATFHLAHNWGNEASQGVLNRYHKVSSYICRRHDREHRRQIEVILERKRR